MSRGRGRPTDDVDRRAAILDAARRRFAESGFAATSMRTVARDAGVDPRLITHYFGSKEQLLVATLELPINPLEKLTAVAAGGPDGFAERLLRTFLGAWDEHRDTFSTLIRSTLAGGGDHPPVIELAQNVVVTTLQDVMDGDDRELRATLVASQLIGMAIARYVARLEPIASAGAEEIARRYAPSLQRLITP